MDATKSNAKHDDSDGQHDANPKVLNQSRKYKIKVDRNGGIYANIRGLFPSTNKTKIPYLQDLANVSNAPFILLTETHLNPQIVDAEIYIENYTLYRSDRIGRSHGGVCTLGWATKVQKFKFCV